ncbi:MAG: ABC transporter permease [Desulfobacterales bacterium]|nr:ABC transporter permease [Desulfobacterales bacterium]
MSEAFVEPAALPWRTDQARIPLGPSFWLPVVWIVLVILLAATAPLWPLPAYDRIDWDHPAATPGTVGLAARPGLDEKPEAAPYTYWLGTDTLGRDIVARLVFGARVSLMVGLCAPTIGFAVGGLLGLLAGFYRGRWETLVVALMDTILAFPALVLLLAVALFWGSRLPVLILTLALLSVPAFCRVARAGTLSWAHRDFILAARAIGASDFRILFGHIAPNILPSTVAYGLLNVAVVIIAEGTLSFLGLSVAAPTPSWGGMIAEGKEVLAETPHVSLFPAGVMFLTVLSFNMLGDRIRELNDLKIYR